jgi:bifunctional N-acetylglucosamine-1-phosphate-uridyltransferase/glucosamine-1-phosphate-acetyltransferase GlmU-like protein
MEESTNIEQVSMEGVVQTATIEPVVETKPKEVKSGTDDVFVMLLLPNLPAFKTEDPLSTAICGRSILGWVEQATKNFASKQIPVQKSDDIMSLVQQNAEDHKYTLVLYADTPLITQNTLESAISYIKTYDHRAARLPRGWIFETACIKSVAGVTAADIPYLPPEDFIVAYNHAQVAQITTLMRGRIALSHLANAVQIIDPLTTYIDAEVTIARGALIEPNTHLIGNTTVAEGTRILSGSRITNSQIGKHVTVNNSQIADSTVGDNTNIGPFANIRANNTIGKNCRITNFVELKNSTVGDKTKIAHMSYVGDAQVGKNCNIGCGVIFCNYNGKIKQTCTLGNNVFVGSNSNLIAPLNIGDNAYIAAGSTINADIPKNALGIARARQAIKEDWNSNDNDE